LSEIPKEIRETLERHLAGISRLFKSPLITIIVRAGDNATGDLVLSADNPTLVIEALRKRMVAEAEKVARQDRE
jgi:regulator of protease activity HflC (stomatin/prohibitin superfamily)